MHTARVSPQRSVPYEDLYGPMQDSTPGNKESNRNADQDMSARKGRQNVKAGFQQMEGIVDSLIERHLSKYSSHKFI